MNSKTKRFYIDVMNCGYTKRQCPQAWKDFSAGLIPRVFTPSKSAEAKILVVAKNPGHPLYGEKAYYAGKTGEDLLRAKEQFELIKYKEIQGSKDKSFKYHLNLRRYLRYFLDLSHELETYEEYQNNYCPDHENDIFKGVALTELFKCSTRNEQAKITSKSFRICYDKYFCREIELFRPRVLLALGKEVLGFLQRQNLAMPLVSIRHPSYFYRKDDERGILGIKKKELKNALKF